MMTRRPVIEAARGDRPCDTVIENVQMVNVFTCEIYAADIGIQDDRIAVVQPAGASPLQGERVIDGQGLWATPGFFDTHVHIESTMVTPPNFCEAVVPLGTTTIVIDPHEIGNVLGLDGVRYMLAASAGLPLRTLLTVPSCVPAVPSIETAGASFGPEDVKEMLEWDRVVGVAEVMDYPGVIQCAPRMEGIVQAGLDANMTIQGHSPRLSGRGLNAYLAAGPESDHEIKDPDELREKLQLGMMPLIKNSSYSNPVPDLAPVLKALPYAEVALCTDDIEPSDLIELGHMNRVVRSMIAEGIDPARAVRFATLNGARHYRLRDLGAIAPGYFADILLLSDLEQVVVDQVFVNGELVAHGGQMVESAATAREPIPLQNSMHLPPLSAASFAISAPQQSGITSMEVLILEPTRLTRRETVQVAVSDGKADWQSLGGDTCLFAIVPRHGQGGAPAVVTLQGLGLADGAMASTISHDSHNLAVAGKTPADMLLAARTVEAMAGGTAVVQDGQVLATLPLPVAGLMATVSVPDLADQVSAVAEAVRQIGATGTRPALALAGLALPVVPAVRLTDQGLVDVDTQTLVPICC